MLEYVEMSLNGLESSEMALTGHVSELAEMAPKNHVLESVDLLCPVSVA